mgnify:FL=1
METLKNPTETKAIKEHNCSFCGEKIPKGALYEKSTHKNDGDIYDWKSHKHCSDLSKRLKMNESAMDSGYEGVSGDFFMETIDCEHDDLLLKQLPKNDINNYSDIIEQFKKVKWRDKFWFVIRYYNRMDKLKAEKINESI